MAERTCVVCRQAGNKAELLRFVVGEKGFVQLDLLQRVASRGAYCHTSQGCLRSPKFERSLFASLTAAEARASKALAKSLFYKAKKVQRPELGEGKVDNCGDLSKGSSFSETRKRLVLLPLIESIKLNRARLQESRIGSKRRIILTNQLNHLEEELSISLEGKANPRKGKIRL